MLDLSNQRFPKTAPQQRWVSRLLALWLLIVLGFSLGQIFILTKPTDLLAGKATAEESLVFLKSQSKQQLLDLIIREELASRDNPLDIEALKNLAALHSLIKNDSEAKKIITLAAGRTVQDQGLSLTALNEYQNQRNYSQALYQLDALARADLEHLPNYLATMSNITTSEDGLKAIVTYFSAHPKWRFDLIQTMVNDKKMDLNIVYKLFSEFKNTNNPATRVENQVFLARLVSDKSYDRAYFVWLDQLSADELRHVAGVYDGDFNFEIGNRFFDWSYTELPNVQASLISRDNTGNDKAFALDFSSARTAFANFSQLLRLGPGDYELSVQSKAVALENERGLVWRIYCLPNIGAALTTTPPVRGTETWATQKAKFTVAPTDCETQILRLELNAIAVVDTQISGRILFDNISIERVQNQP
jgi:hypothetical protein